MLSVALATSGAVVFGVADFMGGLAARRMNATRVVVVSQLIGLLPLAATAVLTSSLFDQGSLVWGALAGVTNAIGLVLFYRGLAQGSMSVVAPVTALASALVPLVAGLLLYEGLTTLAWLGVGAALVAIVLVSAEGGRLPSPRQVLLDRAIGQTLIAGASFGLFFVFISRADAASGVAPLAVARLCSIVLIVTLASRSLRGRPSPPSWTLLAGTGTAGVVGNMLFLYAARLGSLSVNGVIVSLYPAATVLLAVLVLHERTSRVQVAGFALTTVALLLVTWI